MLAGSRRTRPRRVRKEEWLFGVNIEIRFPDSLGDKRFFEYGEVPSVKELGYDFPCPTMLNITGPRDIPQEIVKKLEGAFSRAMKEPTLIKGMKELRLNLSYLGSEEFGKYVVHSVDFFGRLLREKGLAR